MPTNITAAQALAYLKSIPAGTVQVNECEKLTKNISQVNVPLTKELVKTVLNKLPLYTDIKDVDDIVASLMADLEKELTMEYVSYSTEC